MARRQQTKRSDAIASPQNNNTGLVKAALFTVTSAGAITNHTAAPFLLNPNGVEDTKSGNWVENNIPGQSDPVLQWVSGGARNLSFTALVTRDIADSPATDWESVAQDTALTAVGAIASRLAGINIPPLADAKAAFLGTSDYGNTLGISAMLDYYRSLMYPIIDENSKLESSPPLVVLAMGTTLSDMKDKKVSGKITKTNTDLWVTKNVSIRTTKWLPNLAPMEAEVTFQFTQYKMDTQKPLPAPSPTEGLASKVT